ncbi:MAG: hypothetical protein EPO24_12910 [Bacteroidetes bacterium]|nr:MAG: hypothetical protein EPO24_12910 [Bacteroidota bacterium]
MRKLVSTKKFDKAYLRYLRLFPQSRPFLEATLRKLEKDIFLPELLSHKLSGKLEGTYGCSCGYDCRIIYSIRKNKTTGVESIILHNIGTHDQVYFPPTSSLLLLNPYHSGNLRNLYPSRQTFHRIRCSSPVPVKTSSTSLSCSSRLHTRGSLPSRYHPSSPCVPQSWHW